MTFDAWFTLATLAAVFGLLAFSRKGPDLILVGGLAALVLAGVLTPAQAFSGFANEGIVTVAVLFMVAAALRETGGIQTAVGWLFQRPSGLPSAQIRIMAPVAGLSAFLNNTPIVLMLLPVVSDWAKKFQLPASKLLIPLSYASILGGICTMIGTSTNLLVNGLAVESGVHRFQLFDIAWVGVPCAVAGIGFLLVGGRWLLPDRRPSISSFADPREYVLEMVVEENSPLVGKSIEEAGLRHLPGLYLMEVDRAGEVKAAVGPEWVLRGSDRLFFVGVVDSIVDLQRIRGLKPATNQVFKLTAPRSERWLIEAVVSNTSPFIGKSIREGRFRTHYDAVVLGVARNGERIRRKVGDIVLQAGDTLLLEALPSFVEQQKNSRDFYLVSRIEDYTPPRTEKGLISLFILAGMVVTVGLGFISMLKGAMIAAALMVVTGCLGGEAARRSIDWRLLLAIVSAFGIGQAMSITGAAATIASLFLDIASGNALMTLVLVYAVTMVFTEMITNNAAAVLMFPIAMAAAETLGVSPIPFCAVLMIAASCGFATPIGYQTHLMVYGPGGYRFADFLRIGVPMNLLIMLVALLVIPRVWPL